MIIGVDLDDTITELPEFFAFVSAALVRSGHQVHVITYREVGTEDEVLAQLKELGMHYTHLHLPHAPCSPPQWKAEVAAKVGLDLMIEDSPEVLSQMPSSVKRLWLCDAELFNLDVCVSALNHELGVR